jgi:hypothetical protein
MAISVYRMQPGHNQGGCVGCGANLSHVSVTIGSMWMRLCMPCTRELSKGVNGLPELTASKKSRR